MAAHHSKETGEVERRETLFLRKHHNGFQEEGRYGGGREKGRGNSSREGHGVYLALSMPELKGDDRRVQPVAQ